MNMAGSLKESRKAESKPELTWDWCSLEWSSSGVMSLSFCKGNCIALYFSEEPWTSEELYIIMSIISQLIFYIDQLNTGCIPTYQKQFCIYRIENIFGPIVCVATHSGGPVCKD